MSNYDDWKLSPPDYEEDEKVIAICDTCTDDIFEGEDYFKEINAGLSFCSATCAFGVTDKERFQFLQQHYDVNEIYLVEDATCELSGATFHGGQLAYWWVDEHGDNLYETDFDTLFDYFFARDDFPIKFERE